MTTFNTRRPAAQITGNAELRHFRADGDAGLAPLRARDWLTGPGSDLPETNRYLGTTHGAFRRGGDQSHFAKGDLDGKARYMKICMFHLLKHFNMGAWRMPLTLDRRYDAPDGSYADFWLSDGELWTYRLAKGLPPISQIGTIGPNGTGANTPHRTIIAGWAINDSPADFTEFHTITATDVSNGHTAPVGKRVCRVFARAGQPFGWRDNILYAPVGYPYRFADEDRDKDPAINADFEMNKLVANVGQPVTMAWMPVQTSLLEVLPPTYAAPDLFRAKDVQVRAKANGTAAAFDTMHFEITFRREGFLSQTYGIMDVGTVQISARGDGRIRLQVGATFIETPDPDYNPYGGFSTFQFVIDRRADGDMQILNDAGTVLATEKTPTGIEFTGRLRFFDTPPGFQKFDAIFQSALLRLGATTRAGAVTHGFVGDAAAGPTAVSTGGVSVTGLAELQINNSGLLVPATL